MAIEDWNIHRNYAEGERVRWKGQVYAAKFDLPRRQRPDGPAADLLWRKVSTVSVPSVKRDPVYLANPQRSAPKGYLTRDFSNLSKAK